MLFEWIATLCGGLFAGAAIYITLVCPMSLAAQREAEPAFPAAEDTLAVALDRSRAPDVGVLILAGTGGMIAGVLGGGFIGAEIDGDGGLDAAEGAIIGGVMGTSLLIPTAVHLANRGRGNLERSIVTAASAPPSGNGMRRSAPRAPSSPSPPRTTT